jgi:hypothetical protein
VRSLAAAVIRPALVVSVLVMTPPLVATPAVAEAALQQAGRPQAEPATKPAAPKGGPQAPGTPKGTPTSKPGAKTAAKKRAPRTDRGFAVVTGGVVLAAPKHTSTTTFTVHAEDATLEATSRVGAGPAFSVRAGMKVARRMAVGAAVNLAAAAQDAEITASLPHPFLFGHDRPVTGTASGLKRLETMVSVEGTWLVLAKPRRQVSLFAGPAYFNVRQDMASKVRFTEVYPYDTATFVGTETTSVRADAIGVTAGADAAWMVTKRLGVGGEVRYSYGSARLNSGGQSGTIKLGGLQLGVCARFLF